MFEIVLEGSKVKTIYLSQLRGWGMKKSYNVINTEMY